MQLWDFQQEAIDLTRQAFKKTKRVILSLPTGAGKTVIALFIVKSALEKGKRVAFVVDRLSLLDQTARFMFKQGIDFGVIQGNNELTNFSKQFQICSAQTLMKRKKEFDFVIIDECHIMFKHQLEMLKNGNGAYFLGLTATPFTRGLGRYWDDLIFTKRTGELIKDGYLSEYKAYGPSKPDLKGIRTSAGDYNKKDLAERIDKKKIIGDLVEHWFKLANTRHTIVMAVNIAHAEHIAESFKAEGIKADVIHCYLDRGEAQRKLEMFRNGDLQMLSSVDMISRGFDMPQADCLLIARPTKSLNYHLQASGRVLRIAENKENALILDHAGNIERLGFPCDEFDMMLDNGKDKIKEKRAREKPGPKPCPQCFYMKSPGQQVCPNCGFKTKKQPKVRVEKGNLEELQKDRLKRATSENKDTLYAKLLAGAKAAGFKEGWAAYQYKEYFGVWPAKKVNVDGQFYSWLNGQPRHRLIKIIFSLTNKK